MSAFDPKETLTTLEGGHYNVWGETSSSVAPPREPPPNAVETHVAAEKNGGNGKRLAAPLDNKRSIRCFEKKDKRTTAFQVEIWQVYAVVLRFRKKSNTRSALVPVAGKQIVVSLLEPIKVIATKDQRRFFRLVTDKGEVYCFGCLANQHGSCVSHFRPNISGFLGTHQARSSPHAGKDFRQLWWRTRFRGKALDPKIVVCAIQIRTTVGGRN